MISIYYFFHLDFKNLSSSTKPSFDMSFHLLQLEQQEDTQYHSILRIKVPIVDVVGAPLS